MLCFWRWKQVYASTSTVDCDQVCNALSEAGVRYIRKGKQAIRCSFWVGTPARA